MIQIPQRSVTRFFIPLIDVLILLFAIFLLMPLVKATGEAGDDSSGKALSREERAELLQLRKERREPQDVQIVRQELDRLRKEKAQVLQNRLAVRLLEIEGATGKLLVYDPQLPRERRVEITAESVDEVIRGHRATVGDRELYFLILYPRPATGFPLQEQRQQYDRWLADVAHGYDIPVPKS